MNICFTYRFDVPSCGRVFVPGDGVIRHIVRNAKTGQVDGWLCDDCYLDMKQQEQEREREEAKGE